MPGFESAVAAELSHFDSYYPHTSQHHTCFIILNNHDTYMVFLLYVQQLMSTSASYRASLTNMAKATAAFADAMSKCSG